MKTKHKIRFIVSASYSPTADHWIGLSVEMLKVGTHHNYNIIYNGDCIDEHFSTEKRAKQAARKARKNSKKSYKSYGKTWRSAV